MNASGEVPKVRRRLPAESWALIFLAVVIVMLIAAGFWYMQNLSAQPEMSQQTAAAIVERGSQLLDTGPSAEIWAERLTSGQVSIGEYLLRLFVSPGYLSGQADDRQFAVDSCLVLTGLLPSDTELDAAVKELAAAGSRLVYLNSLIERAGFHGQIKLPENVTQISSFTAAELPQPAGSEAVGLVPFSFAANLTDRQAWYRLYNDGSLRQSQTIDAVELTAPNQFQVDWDTRIEAAGTHKLTLLVQTSDGRGIWLDLNSYVVPKVIPLTSAQLLNGETAAGGSVWYSLPITDNQALLTVVDSDSRLNLLLQDLHGRELAATTSVAGLPAALRGKSDDLCYVRISADSAAKYQLMPALAAARLSEDDSRLLAVLAINGDQLEIIDKTGKASWQPAADYDLIDTTARLSRLSLTMQDGSDAGYVQSFDPQSMLYGLVVSSTVSQLNLSALTMEGSAADLNIELINENGASAALTPGEPVLLAPSVNRLRLSVTGFDDSSRSYEVNILRPPHSAGYDLTLAQFPDSYHSPVWLMHVQHPSWQFTVYQTGIDWATFIAAEDKKDISLVQANHSPASWVEPGSPVYDGADWKAADVRVIEYFADPRNALDEIDVFQFEKMTYNQAIHNIDGMNAVLANSFMAAGNTQGIDYASLILKAGQTAGISPYFLAAKIMQEMGRQGESLLATGSLPGYEGVYNFYNIGSTPNPSVTNGALINGARYALYGKLPDEQVITPEEELLLLPWKTPEAAITGGAIWIAQRYVSIGQDTPYLQKFDLIDDGSLFTHQYAQNIQMAWSEARNTRKAYSGIGILDQAFLFSIPVFENMPAKAAVLP